MADRLARRGAGPGPGRVRPGPAHDAGRGATADPDRSRGHQEEARRKKNRPPFEFFRSQVAPFDVLPYVKANHWSTLTLEMRANDDDYDGSLQTDPVKLWGCRIECFTAATPGC